MAPKWRPATAGASSTSCVPHQSSGPSRCPIGRKSFTSQISHSLPLGSPSGPAASSLKQVSPVPWSSGPLALWHSGTLALRHSWPSSPRSRILGPHILFVSTSSRALRHRPNRPSLSLHVLTRCAGTGSASFSHSVARTIGSAGKLHSFEFHQERAAIAKLVCIAWPTLPSHHPRLPFPGKSLRDMACPW